MTYITCIPHTYIPYWRVQSSTYIPHHNSIACTSHKTPMAYLRLGARDAPMKALAPLAACARVRTGGRWQACGER